MKSPERKLELRQHNVMGHTYAYRGYKIFIRVDDVQGSLSSLNLITILRSFESFIGMLFFVPSTVCKSKLCTLLMLKT